MRYAGSVWIGKEKFQSPLRRGSVFIARYGHEFVEANEVSIPSSSGKCLHRVKPLQEAWIAISFNPLFVGEVSSSPTQSTNSLYQTSFNPLFVGEVSSSGTASRVSHDCAEFQSPLRRGRVFIHKFGGGPPGPPRFQSPLRRRSVFITLGRDQKNEVSEFQSPLRRGSVFISGGGKSK